MADAKETLRQLVNKIATEYKYENHEIIINEISSGGANYTSKLFTVIITEENKEDLHLFAKVAAAGDAFRNELPSDVYKTEQFAYIKLAKVYASLEEENGVPEEHRLYFTKFYGFDPSTYQETLVLENLLAHGYGAHDRFHSIDWEYASSAVRDLAKMHALSFAFSKQYPEEFGKALTALKFEWQEFRNMEVMLQRTTSVALSNVKPEYREALQKFMENQKNPFQMTAPIHSTVIVHGDFRGDNLLHRVRENGKVDIKIVDLQTLQGGSPVTDLIYFIISGSDAEFRAKYYDKLLDHYYTQLSAAMKRLNLDPEETFSREAFDYETEEAWQHRFSHLIGYGAKYYSYLISRGIAWSVWHKYFQDQPLCRTAGENLRQGLLRHGGAVPPQNLLRDYLQEDVTPTTLANALAEELDHHKDHLDTVFKILQK